MIEDLLGKLNEQPDPPCSKFSCTHRDTCSAQELACSAFANYYQTGESVHPFWDFPQRRTALLRPIWREQALPSKRIWALIEADDWNTNNVPDTRLDSLVDKALDERAARQGPDHWLSVGVQRAKIALERFKDGR